jgi:hypothetical protein
MKNGKRNIPVMATIAILVLMVLTVVAVWAVSKSGTGNMVPLCIMSDISGRMHGELGDANMTLAMDACIASDGTWYDQNRIVACISPEPLPFNCSAPLFTKAKQICDGALARWRCDIMEGYVGCDCNYPMKGGNSTTTTTTVPGSSTTTTSITVTSTSTSSTTTTLACYDSDYGDDGGGVFTAGYCVDSLGTWGDWCSGDTTLAEATCSPIGSSNPPCQFIFGKCVTGYHCDLGRCVPD